MDLERDRLFSLGMTRILEVIGEAANRVPVAKRDQFPGINWGEIIGTRNRLIHGYDIVDHDVVWDTLTEGIPPLIEALEKALSDIE